MENINIEKLKLDKLIRDFENTKYFGYMFFVKIQNNKKQYKEVIFYEKYF